MKEKLELKTADMAELFLTSCAGRGLSPLTVKWYEGYLKVYGRQYPCLPMDPAVIEAFVGTYKGDERRHGCYRALRTFYNFLGKRLDLPNPINRINPPRRCRKEKAIPSLEDIRKILDYPGHSKDIRAALYTLADTGARIGEVHSLVLGDIDHGSIKIRGKTGERIMPISPEVQRMLEGLGPGRLFPGCITLFDKKISRAIASAGFPQFTAHSLRHAFASHWKGSDMSLKTIGGWHSWAMVEHYSHRKLEKAMEEHVTQGPLAKIYGSQAKPADPPAAVRPVPELGDYSLARNQFYYHALLCNIGKNLLSMFHEYSDKHIVKDFCAARLIRDVLDRNDIDLVDELPDDYHGNEEEEAARELEQGIEAEASAMWDWMAFLIEPFISENETKANLYLNLSQEQTEVEDVQFSDLGLIWREVSRDRKY